MVVQDLQHEEKQIIDTKLKITHLKSTNIYKHSFNLV